MANVRPASGEPHNRNHMVTMGSPVSTGPCSLSIWHNQQNTGGGWLLNNNIPKTWPSGWHLGLGASNVVLFTYGQSSGFGFASVNALAADGVWEHYAAVAASATLRNVWGGGTKSANDTTNVPFPTGINQMSIGAAIHDGPTGGVDGSSAEAAIWDVALTDEEVASLSVGVSPLLVRPQSLKGYWPMFAGHLAREL